MTQFIDTLVGIFQSSGFAKFGEPGGYLYAVMICVGCFLLYLAIVKEFEPLILLPMAFGMILANLPGSGIIHMQYFIGDGLEHPMWVEILNNGGLADMLYMGVKLGIYPPLIFLGIGTMTDFAPLISNPKSLLLGAAAQFGIFGTYMGAGCCRPCQKAGCYHHLRPQLPCQPLEEQRGCHCPDEGSPAAGGYSESFR